MAKAEDAVVYNVPQAITGCRVPISAKIEYRLAVKLDPAISINIMSYWSGGDIRSMSLKSGEPNRPLISDVQVNMKSISAIPIRTDVLLRLATSEL